MNEKIVLNAAPEAYRECFPGAWVTPSAEARASGPGDALQMVHMPDRDIVAVEAIWGFVPMWRTVAGDPVHYAAGARITRDWMVSVAFRNWRCIVPATSFTCVRRVDGVTMRYTMAPTGGGLMLLGGVFEPNAQRDGGAAPTLALVTTGPNRLLAPHGLQVPLILGQKQVLPWLRCRKSNAAAKGLIQAPGKDSLTLTICVEHGAGVDLQAQADLQLA